MASIEEQIEDIAKKQFDNHLKYFTKTEPINPEIENALKQAPSKSGGSGNNYPDIKLLIQDPISLKDIPVMIECKGTKGDLIKENENGEIDNLKKDGTSNFTNIKKYAVNGAVHYAKAILDYTETYDRVIAIGYNGYKENDNIITEMGVYYLSKENFCIPQKIENYTDFSFLYEEYRNNLTDKIKNLYLTDEQIEAKAKDFENQIEIKLKELNQKMHDDLNISEDFRVKIVTGLIMAGLGVERKISPLEISDLKGFLSQEENDGKKIINKISSFLSEKSLPEEKRNTIINSFSVVFLDENLYKPRNGESPLKTIYSFLNKNIIPIFKTAKHLDFTGKLFNVLNAWVRVPDSGKNDVVLTPRYVTDLMAKLAQVNKDSYVWDNALGTGGFLISAMKLMIKDAESKIKDPKELEDKILKIKTEQLLGIELRSDIYLLAVLNMILMGDGSSHILNEDSLLDYTGTYEQGEKKNEIYPANVYLLNPPYSADGKGLIFVKNAFDKMKENGTLGRACILIQENAGSGQGLPFSKEILENNTLKASVHMSDIFCGKAGVQTAIYLFDTGTSHNEDNEVVFIDFSNDGYTRQNRKKSGQDVNLRDTDHAEERYKEIADIVLGRKRKTYYIKDSEIIRDTISLNGDDWTFKQHIKIDTEPTEEDFKKTVADYLAWKVGALLKGEIDFEM